VSDQGGGEFGGPGALRRRVRICNKLGLHARAAVKFVQLAGTFQSEIMVGRAGQEANGKSIMGLLTLVAAWGVEIDLAASGADAAQALDALAALVARGFDEGAVDA
jgi:phosphocarrier protein HPr